jgi:hypothetical protein
MIYNVLLSNGSRVNLLEYIKAKKAKGKFTVIDIGGSINGWSKDVVDAIVDIHTLMDTSNIMFFRCDITNQNDYTELMDYVTANGKFDFCICSHTLEDIMNPVFVCDQICKVAQEGYIAFPSKYRELSPNIEGAWRGYIHHRWIFDVKYNCVIGYPKISMIECNTFFDKIADSDSNKADISFYWKHHIEMSYVNNNYLGPNRDAVCGYYRNLKD